LILIHNIVLNHDSVLINDRVFLFSTEHFGNNLQKIQTDSVSTFSERKRTSKNIGTQNILEKVGELGFISVEKNLTLPKQQIQNGRLNPVVDFISKISITKDYFFTLFDGWREWTDYSDEKIYIPVTDALLENFVNLGSAGETGRFIKKKTSAVPDFIYPKLPYQVLCYCRHKGDTEAVLIPDSEFLGTRGYVELKKEIDFKNIPFNRKLNIAYWRGNRTGIGYKKYSKYLLSQREMCVNLNSPNIDAKFSINTDKSEFLRHKFLIDIDGEVNAWSGLFWKLYSGSVVIKIESHWEQWYYPLLKPWENYVPVKGDLSDFSEVMERLLKDPELCLKISRNGRRLAESLTYENVLNNFVL
jgi:hypothetical protein